MMHRVARALGAAILVVVPLLFTVDPTSAQFPPPCPPPGDFLTGGGFIVNATGTTPGFHANFGVGGGCKEGGNGHGLWGHLEYIDHGTGLKVHWTKITAYMNDISFPPDPNARVICGTATTNDPLFTIVDFLVRAADHDESGGFDQFDIVLSNGYNTFPAGPHSLVGGNIILHKPNPSTMRSFNNECPALNFIM